MTWERLKDVVIIVTMIWLLYCCTGCMTVQGIGQDLQMMSENYTQN